MVRTGMLAILATSLAACGSEEGKEDPEKAAFVAACVAGGDNEAGCVCQADALETSLDRESFAAVVNFAEALASAESDAAKGMVAMSAFANPKLVAAMEKVEQVAETCAAEVKTATTIDRAQPPAGGKLAGTYLPQLGRIDPSERRLAAATADKRWLFSEDGRVVTYPTSGPGSIGRNWSYEIRGKEIRLVGADSGTGGERRRFTLAGDGRCIWDGRGDGSIDMLFCPQ